MHHLQVVKCTCSTSGDRKSIFINHATSSFFANFNNTLHIVDTQITTDLIRMLILWQLHDLPVNVQVRQFWPGILVPSMDEPPRDSENQYAD